MESDSPSKYTLLLDQETALTLDRLALELRRRVGHRVEKSEILRALIRQADANPLITEALAGGLAARPR